MTPFVLAQLSDPHVGATWAPGRDPEAGLAAAVERLTTAVGRPDAVLVTGDLTDHATDAEYERVRELLAPLGAPVHVLPGNHDDRAALRRHFGLPGASAEPVHHLADLGPLALVVLDTMIPGDDSGTLEGTQLEWLDATLAEHADRPVALATHHPPLLTGATAWDDYALGEASRRGLAEVVGRHPHVAAILSGHLHRTTTGRLAGRPVLVAPSTYVQMRLSRATTDEIELSDEPPAFVVHTLLDGDLVSVVQS